MPDYGKYKRVKAALIVDIVFFNLTLIAILIASIYKELPMLSTLYLGLVFFTGLNLPIELKNIHFIWNSINIVGILSIPIVALLVNDKAVSDMYIFMVCAGINSLLVSIAYLFVKRKMSSTELLKVANVIIVIFGTIRYRSIYLMYHIAIQILCALIVFIIKKGLDYVRRPANVDRVK